MFYNNPVKRGFFPDPSVVRVGEDYYMVNSSFQYFPAIPISHSRDLVHWETIAHAITDSDFLDLSETLDSRGIWAPDISYFNNKFYIFATLRHNYSDASVHPMRTQLVMTADRPEGPYSRPVALPVDNIDPSHFIDDGRHYMIIAPGITVVPLNDDCTEVTGSPVQVWGGTGERCPEGPHILKHNGWYYAILAEGGTGYGHGINIGRSRSLFGEYEPCPYNPVMRQTDPEALIQRSGHGKLVETQNGEWYCLYLCGRRNGGNYTTIGRETALDPVTWTEDGWFLINEGRGPSEKQVFPNLPITAFEENNYEDLSKPLSLNWEWVRNPEKNMFRTAPNGLVFKTTPGRLGDISAKNTLVRRECELKYTAVTKLAFDPDDERQRAGLVCYYSTVSYACLYKTVNKLTVAIARNKGEETIKEIPVEGGEIYLKVEVDGLTRKWYYSFDNVNFTLVCTLENCVYLCDEGVPDDPKRHTGTLVGIFANHGDCGKSAEARFEFFDYK